MAHFLVITLATLAATAPTREATTAPTTAPTSSPSTGALDDQNPLGGQRQVAVGDRLPRVLELLAMDAGVVVPMQGGPFPVVRALELADRLRTPGPVPVWTDGPLWWEVARAPLTLSAVEDAALRFNLRSFAVYADDGIALQLSVFGGPEVYARSSAVDVGTPWEVGFRERGPLLGLDSQFSWRLFDDVEVWGRGTFDLRQDQNLYTAPTAVDARTNIPPPEGIDVSFPHRAVVGVGGDRWALNLGRDRLDVGNGQMGNLMLGDSADFHDFARAQFFLPQFTWTSLVLRLDPTLLDDEGALPGMGALRSQEKHLVIHRLEAVVLEKLHLAVSEGTMVGGVPLDLRHLNPLLVFHNQFGWNDVAEYESASILLTLEATLVPIRGVRLWGQFGINQLQSGLEREWFPQAASIIPDATGGLAGVELTMPVTVPWAIGVPRQVTWVKPTGVIHVYGGAEIVETSPWFGIRENPLITWSSRRRLPSNLPGGTEVVEQPLGWRFGPDSRVWRLWAGALDTGLGSCEFGLEERTLGEHTLRTPYEASTAAVAQRTPTGTPERQRVFTLQAELLPLRLDRFSATVRLDWRHFLVDNLHHVAGSSLIDDHLTLGVRVDL